MPPYDSSVSPVALPGEAVRLEPGGDVFVVEDVEQMARVGPVDYGSAPAGQQATENGSNTISLEDELEMNNGTLGQFWVNPLSDVEVEIRQEGQQEQRFVNSNAVGVITPRTPASMRQVFVSGGDDIYAIVTNPKEWDMAKTLVYYTGYKFGVSPASESDVRNMGGEPATVPIGSLKQGGRR